VDEARILESGGLCLAAPRLERERMRDPGVAAVGVVLHDDESAGRDEDVADRRQDRPPIADEVEAVCRQDAVERPGRDPAREVGDLGHY
jgi:hypothetical protein